MSTTLSSYSSAAAALAGNMDAVGEILSRLPLSSVLRCRLVCKEWCSLTSTQSFIDMHENNYQPSIDNNNSCFVVQYFDNGTNESTSTSDHFNTLFFNLDQDDNDNSGNNNMKMKMKMKMVREYIDLSNINFSGAGKDEKTYYGIRNNFVYEKTYYHIKLISSCRGFLLFTAKPAANMSVSCLFGSCWQPMEVEEDPALVLYNPVTKEQVTVIAPPSTHVYCGFYYHSPTKEHRILYQLIEFDPHHHHHAGVVKFLVFSLEADTRRVLTLEKVSSPLDSAAYYYHPDPSTPPVISNGSLHWIVSEDDHHGHFHGRHLKIPSCSQSILSFGMESEEFRLMPHPTLSHSCSPNGGNSNNGHRHQMNLLEMEGGILCLCDGYGSRSYQYYRKPIVEIYVMEDYEKWNWVRRYLIDLGRYILSGSEYGLHYKALQILQGDQLLLHYHHPDDTLYEEYALYSLNQQQEEIDFEKQLECTFTDKKKNKRQRFQVMIDGYPGGKLLGRLRRIIIIKPAMLWQSSASIRNMVVLTPSFASFHHNRSAPPANPTLFSV